MSKMSNVYFKSLFKIVLSTKTTQLKILVKVLKVQFDGQTVKIN